MGKNFIKNEKGEIAVEYAILIGIFGFLGFILLNFVLQALGGSFLDTYNKINLQRP